MTPTRHSFPLVLLLAGGTLLTAACGPSDADGESRAAGDSAFDLAEVGMRGMEWTSGSATLLEAGLDFEPVEMQLDTISFYLMGAHRDMTEFDSPPLEFRGEPVTMALRIGGVVKDHEPGRFTVEISSVYPTFSGGLGSSSEHDMMEDLAANGIEIPEASSEEPILVTFDVVPGDEDYDSLTLTADVDWIHEVEVRDGGLKSL